MVRVVQTKTRSRPPAIAVRQRRRWYRALVHTTGGERLLVVIEATSAHEARRHLVTDWGEKNVGEARRL